MVLLELIVALTVFALVAFSLVGALDAGMTVAGERDHIDAATRGLANELALLHAGRIDPGNRKWTGADDLQYQLTIAPEEARNEKHQPLTHLYRVTVEAAWPEGRATESRSVSELVYQP
jgi:hypothetical protein